MAPVAVVSAGMFAWKQLSGSQNPCHHHHHHHSMATQTPSAARRTSSLHVLRPSISTTTLRFAVVDRRNRFGFQVRAKQNDEEGMKRLRDKKRIEEALPDLAELGKDELQAFLDLDLESSFDFEQSRHYEMVFLIHEACAEEVPAVVKDVKDYIREKKGKIWRLNDWGMRNLAYKIKKASRANYILMNIEMSSQAIDGLKTLLDKDERVIRHLVMKEKKAITEPTEPPEEYFPTQALENDHSSSVDDNVTDEEGEDEEAEEEEEVEEEEGEDEEELEEVDNLRDELVLR